MATANSPSSISGSGGADSGGSGGGFAALIGRFEKVAQSAQEKQTSLVVAHGGDHSSSSTSPGRSWRPPSTAAATSKAIAENEASSGNATATSHQEESNDQNDNREIVAEADDSESDDEAKESSGSAAPGSFAAVIEQFEKNAKAASNAATSSSEVGNTSTVRAPSDESNTRNNLTKSTNTGALLEIATNASDTDGNIGNPAFMPTDDEATNDSQNDSHHSAEEETEALIKEALILSASSSNIPSLQQLPDEEIASDENTDETHDDELNAFYKSMKKSKRKVDAFVPPTHILPHRSKNKKKRDAFGDTAPKQVEIVHSQTEEKQVISREITQRSDSHQEDSTGDGGDPDDGIVREPGGHRIEEDYSKPPPHYVEAQPSRRRQHIRNKQVQQQLAVPSTLNNKDASMPVILEDTSASQLSQLDNIPQQPQGEPQEEPQTNCSTSPATSLTSSEPRGKRLTIAYKASEIPGHHITKAVLERRPPPKKVINQERLQSAQDCKGILPKNQMYPVRRTPVDVPGSKLPNKFPGQSDVETKVTILQQQVALAEQIIRLRTMKQESGQLKASLKVQQTLVQKGISTTDDGGDGNDCIAQHQQEQQDTSKKLAPEASFQNRSALLAKLTSQPNSLTDFQKKSALLAKLTTQPTASTQQKQQEVNSTINNHKYQEQHHKELMEKFEGDSRVTQNMHDEMVKLVHASFASNKSAKASLAPSPPTEKVPNERTMSQKQLLRQLEYDSLRQQLEYENLMRKLGKMMTTKAFPRAFTNASPNEEIPLCRRESIPFDERQPNARNSNALGRNTSLERKEQRTKSPARKQPLDAPPMLVTVSKAPLPPSGLRTIDAIPVPGTRRNHSTSRARPPQAETAPLPEAIMKEQAVPAPQSQQMLPRASGQEEKTGMEVAQEKSKGFELSKGWEKSIENQQQKSEKDRWRQILASSGSLV